MKNYRDLAGDGGSDVLGQVREQQRLIEANLSGLRQVLAIGSGKGGVGKSTIAMLLALGFKSRGIRTVVLDADFNGPTQSRLGALQTRVPVPGPGGLLVPKTQSGVGVLSFGTLVPESQAVDFPSVSSGDSHVWRASREFSVLGDLLARTDWEDYEILLIDLPPGAERIFQYAEFLGPRVDFVLVTLSSAVSKGVVRRSAAALAAAGARTLGYIENMAGYYCSECRRVQPLFPVADEDFALTCLGRIPFDPGLADACDRGLAFGPSNEFPGAAWILDLTRNLEALFPETR